MKDLGKKEYDKARYQREKLFRIEYLGDRKLTNQELKVFHKSYLLLINNDLIDNNKDDNKRKLRIAMDFVKRNQEK